MTEPPERQGALHRLSGVRVFLRMLQEVRGVGKYGRLKLKRITDPSFGWSALWLFPIVRTTYYLSKKQGEPHLHAT